MKQRLEDNTKHQWNEESFWKDKIEKTLARLTF